MHGPKLPYRYDHYTWPEFPALIARQPVCIIPIGSVEDHGRHLPLDTDNFLIASVCDAVAERIPEEVLLLPVIPYGFEDHHMSFPGTITVKPEHLEAFVLDITLSLAHHGFQKILLADGHGSNMPILDLAARKTIIQSNALCACFIWPSLITGLLKETRESPFPGGMSHACELETSVYLYLNESAVYMDRAVREIDFHKSKLLARPGGRPGGAHGGVVDAHFQVGRDRRPHHRHAGEGQGVVRRHRGEPDRVHPRVPGIRGAGEA